MDPETIHAVSLTALHEEFAEVVTTEELMKKLKLSIQTGVDL